MDYGFHREVAIAAWNTRADINSQLLEAGDDVIRASNTLMLMLLGDLAITKPSLRAAIRRASDARDAWARGIIAGADVQSPARLRRAGLTVLNHTPAAAECERRDAQRLLTSLLESHDA